MKHLSNNYICHCDNQLNGDSIEQKIRCTAGYVLLTKQVLKKAS